MKEHASGIIPLKDIVIGYYYGKPFKGQIFIEVCDDENDHYIGSVKLSYRKVGQLEKLFGKAHAKEHELGTWKTEPNK